MAYFWRIKITFFLILVSCIICPLIYNAWYFISGLLGLAQCHLSPWLNHFSGTLCKVASVRSIPFLSFIEPLWNVSLVFLIFLKRSLAFPILFFPSISLHWALRKAFLPLLTILWNSAFRWIYLSFSPLPFASLLFSPICKTFSDNHFAFLYFFLLGMVFITTSCTMLWTSIHSFFQALSIRSNPLNLFVTSSV